jgi:hypothetical protein
MSKNGEVQQGAGQEQQIEKQKNDQAKNIVAVFLEDCMSINKINPDQAKEAIHSIGQGIVDGSGKRAGNYINHALANPISSAMELGSSAAVGIGLSLANKKLAAGAAMLALGDVAFKTATGMQDTYVAAHNFLFGKSDASILKRVASKSLGSVTGDTLIMAGTGVLAGGAVKASRFSFANATKLTNFIKERRSVSKSLNEFSKMESSIFRPVEDLIVNPLAHPLKKITITPREINNKTPHILSATKELIGKDPIYGKLELGANGTQNKTISNEYIGENLERLTNIARLQKEVALHRNTGNTSEAIKASVESLAIQKGLLPKEAYKAIDDPNAIRFAKSLKELSLLYWNSGQLKKSSKLEDYRNKFCRDHGLSTY